MAGFQRDRIGPLEDGMSELSSWYGFSTAAKQDWEWQCAAPEEVRLPFTEALIAYSDSFKGVGRNDPCPCGSSKKFKKCCLH